jgi:hypothetical protein
MWLLAIGKTLQGNEPRTEHGRVSISVLSRLCGVKSVKL